jgi:hypothetical protein
LLLRKFLKTIKGEIFEISTCKKLEVSTILKKILKLIYELIFFTDFKPGEIPTGLIEHPVYGSTYNWEECE